MKKKKKRPDHRSYIGSYDAAPIMGLSSRKTAVDVFLEKSGLKDPEDLTGNKAVEWGLKLESFAINEAQRILGVKTHGAGFRTHPQLNYVGGHIDAKFLDQQKKRNIVETKTGLSRRYENGLPPEIEYQCRHYMAIWDAPRTYVIVALLDRRDFLKFVVERDLFLEERLLEKYVEFWDRVEKGIPPEPSIPSDHDRLGHFSLDEIGEAQVDDLNLIHEIEIKKLDIDKLEKEKRNLEDRLKMRMGERGASALEQSGRMIATFKEIEKQSIDVKRLRLEYPEVAKTCSKLSLYRQLRILN